MDKEYIEREALLAGVDTEFFKTDPSREEQLGFLKCRRIIREIPADDVAPVVRCEHCKFCSTVVDFIGNCQSFCGESPTPRMVKPKDFCSYGERKEDTP